MPGAVQINSKRNSCWFQRCSPKAAVQRDVWAGTQVRAYDGTKKGVFASTVARMLVSFTPSQRGSGLPCASVYPFVKQI